MRTEQLERPAASAGSSVSATRGGSRPARAVVIGIVAVAAAAVIAAILVTAAGYRGPVAAGGPTPDVVGFVDAITSPRAVYGSVDRPEPITSTNPFTGDVEQPGSITSSNAFTGELSLGLHRQVGPIPGPHPTN
jgi:hypothetical protein